MFVKVIGHNMRVQFFGTQCTECRYHQYIALLPKHKTQSQDVLQCTLKDTKALPVVELTLNINKSKIIALDEAEQYFG